MKDWTDALVNQLYATWVITVKSTKRSVFRKRCLILLAICLLPVLAAILWRVLAPPGRHGPTAYQMYASLMVTSFLQFLVPIVPLFLGTAAINDEIEEKTLMFLFLRPVSKFIVVFAKTLSVMVSSVVILGGTAVLIFCICASHPEAAMIPSHLPLLTKDLGVFALASFAYGSLFLLMGVLFRRPHIPGLIFVFAWDEYAAYLPGKAGILNIKHYVTSIFPHAADMESPLAILAYHTPEEPLISVIVLIAMGVGFSFLAFQVFRNKDYGFEKAAA
ncbi:MAG: ABC transporter permease [bacterium]